MNRLFPLLLLLLGCAAPVAAQDPGDPDVEGCKDSALLTRMPGCSIFECSTKEFDEATVWTAAWKEDDSQLKKLEGAVEILRYICPARLSPLQIARNAEAALKKAGYAVVYSGQGESDYPIVTARKGAQWVEVQASAFNENTQYRQTAVLVQEMAQELQADASAMAEAIEKTGSVAVYGITFETGKATLTPDSEKVLQEVLTLMKEHAPWRFEVQGHTDNVGAKAANQSLSEQRAVSVVAWLVKNGIDKGRLSARGYGDTQPVADNTSDEGRAKNRRVELKRVGE